MWRNRNATFNLEGWKLCGKYLRKLSWWIHCRRYRQFTNRERFLKHHEFAFWILHLNCVAIQNVECFPSHNSFLKVVCFGVWIIIHAFVSFLHDSQNIWDILYVAIFDLYENRAFYYNHRTNVLQKIKVSSNECILRNRIFISKGNEINCIKYTSLRT